MGLRALLSSGRFLGFWVILELNLILFLGLLLLRTREFKFLGTIKYFIVQSLASSLLLLGFLRERFERFNGFRVGLVSGALLIKVGVAPFQEWFLSLISDQTWEILGLLRTAQKFGPLIGLTYFLRPFLVRVSLTLRVVFSIRGVSQAINIRQMLGHSAVFNTGWLLITPGSGGFILGISLYRYSTLLVISFFIPNNVFN